MLNSFEKDLSHSLTGQVRALGHPDEVVRDETLSLNEKRSLLASWASDSHAVPDAPALRQLDSGAIVAVDDILRALRALDGEDATLGARAARQADGASVSARSTSRSATLIRLQKTPARRTDDDDDPPPYPAAGAIPLPPRYVHAVGRLAA